MSVFKVKSGRKAGQFCAQIDIGLTPKGARRYKRRFFATEREAKRAEAKLREAFENGSLSVGERQTLEAFLLRWFDHKRRSIKASTLTDYTEPLTRHAIPVLGKKYLEKITVLDIQHLIDRVSDSVSVSQARRVLSRLRMALTDAVRWQLLTINLAKNVKPPKDATKAHSKAKNVKHLEREALQRLFLAAKGHRLFVLLYTAVVTGMRIGELLGLRWQDIDSEGLTISVVQNARTNGKVTIIGTTKTKASTRTFSINPEHLKLLAVQRLQQAKERQQAGEAWIEHGVVFASEVGTLLGYQNTRKVLRQWAAAAGIGHVGWHMMRHSHTSLLLAKGISAKEVAERIGHEDLKHMLETYAHTFAEQKPASALALGEVLDTAGLFDSPDDSPAPEPAKLASDGQEENPV
jgi:integrase